MKRCRFFLIAIILTGLVFGSTQTVTAKGLIKEGKQREYYSNGKLRIENIYKKGQIVRKRNYYQNGRLMSEFKYKNGEEYSRRTFYENGQLKSIWTAKSGVTKYYRKSGSLRLIVNHNQEKPNYRSSYIYSSK